jgi:hypothetical protein
MGYRSGTGVRRCALAVLGHGGGGGGGERRRTRLEVALGSRFPPSPLPPSFAAIILFFSGFDFSLPSRRRVHFRFSSRPPSFLGPP